MQRSPDQKSAGIGRPGRFVALAAFLLAFLHAAEVRASESGGGSLHSLLSSQLQQRFAGARIELQDFAFRSSANGMIPAQASEVLLMNDDGRGTITFTADGVQGSARFHAWVPAWIPSRRLAPLEKLSRDQFAQQEVDVSSGRWRDLRGLILPPNADLDHLETRQTLLEGEAVLSSAVTPTPDVRRGDPVRVRLISGEIVLSTQATAVENGFRNGTLRVLTDRSKRELVGRLLDGRTVEVTL